MVELYIDGKKIPLNKYVKSVFLKIILALISTLKGVPESWNEIEIKIRSEEADNEE